MMMNDDLILEKLKTYCAYQERCENDVVKKLKDFGVPETQIPPFIDFLKEYDFLNESRFLESYIKGKINIKRWGKLKILTHLTQKRINRHAIEKHLNKIPHEQFYDNALKLAIFKLGNNKLTLKEKSKIQRYLYQKGYENDIIYEVLKALERKNH